MLEDYPAILDASDIAQILRLSRAGAYQVMRDEGFPLLCVGKRMLCPKDELIKWIKSNTIQVNDEETDDLRWIEDL